MGNMIRVNRMNKTKRILKTVLLLSVVLVVAVSLVMFRSIEINGSSMVPTLEQNDRVLANIYPEVERFDVIVFRDRNDQPVVKRVIGLPGETVRYENDQLYVDGEPMEEPFLEDSSLQAIRGSWTSDFSLEEVIDQTTIPSDSYFVLGDNRRFSLDSRVYGTVPEEAVIGEVVMVLHPFNRMALVHD